MWGSILVFVAWLVTLQELSAAESVREPLCISSANARLHRFAVEVADEPAERRRGLMFRHSLPRKQGMFFVYPVESPVVMWMKNTFISLDMLFIHEGRVSSIETGTIPGSESLIRSNGPVRAVLELGGGEARRLGIRLGDRVLHPLLGANCP